MAVAIFRIISGEEIIGDVVKTDNDTNSIEVKNPALMIMQQQSADKVGLGLLPFMPYADGNITIKVDHITAECEPSTEVRNEYSRIFGSGIQIASAGSV